MKFLAADPDAMDGDKTTRRVRAKYRCRGVTVDSSGNVYVDENTLAATGYKFVVKQ